MRSPFHEIREATRPETARLHASRCARALHDGTLTSERRASLARALHAVYSELEHAALTSDLPALRDSQPRLANQRAHLERELAASNADARAVDAAVLRALVLAQHIRRDASRSAAMLIGHLFALEASEVPGLPPSAAGRAAAELEVLLGAETQLAEATTGARQALEGLEAIFDVVVSSQWADLLAGALNSEAGTHPIPADVQEVRAALTAGERTWREFRYYEARYGERGLRFTRSDSAWLVTLAREEPDQARRQIAWLGRVLATRGMPQLLLELHLEQLHAELTARLPDRAASYVPLLHAAGELGRARRAVLSDADAERAAASFAPSAPLPSPISAKEAGRLLVAAVVDEARGIPQAVDSLCRWLDDPARFPPAWREAVAQTLHAARAACERSNG